MSRTPNEPDPGASPLALLAYEHRRYRKAAGLTQVELAAELHFTNQFVAMVEVAARTPGRQYVENADRILGANGGLIACWKLVSRMHIPKWFGPFIDVEAKATAMREWELAFVPGLFQTAEYARALARADRPNATEEQIEHEVDVRMQRQEILHREDPPMFWAIIDEYVFHRPVGGPELMRAQYAQLLKIAELPHVDIQILPFDAGPHPGQIGAFEILDLQEPREIVWVENTGEGYFIDRPELVAEYVQRYDHLRAAALSPTASQKMITARLEETCASPIPADSPGASPATALAKAGTASK